MPTNSYSSEPAQQMKGMGTGIFVDERGYIVTNNHVVEGVRRINVTLHDGTETVARLIAQDPSTDLAVIKISVSRPMELINIGRSNDLMIGEDVIAVGNAFGYEHTVTRGIISALHRNVQVSDSQKYFDLIQTDAAINPGNSGGPLLNIDGELIGINVAVRQGAQCIGFAIPIDRALEVATQLLSTERVSKTWHGLITEPTDSLAGVTTVSVRANSPAVAAGIQTSDIVTQLNGRRIERPLDIERALLDVPSGSEVSVVLNRSGQSYSTKLSVASTVRSAVTRATANRSVDDTTWDSLGLRLVELSDAELRRYQQKLNKTDDMKGGLRVVSVRSDSPAIQQGLRPGDVLIGLHRWETRKMDHVNYVLSQPEVKNGQQLKFHIVRGGDTLYGYLPVSWVR